jgi:hypothetical protein
VTASASSERSWRCWQACQNIKKAKTLSSARPLKTAKTANFSLIVSNRRHSMPMAGRCCPGVLPGRSRGPEHPLVVAFRAQAAVALIRLAYGRVWVPQRITERDRLWLCQGVLPMAKPSPCRIRSCGPPVLPRPIPRRRNVASVAVHGATLRGVYGGRTEQ